MMLYSILYHLDSHSPFPYMSSFFVYTQSEWGGEQCPVIATTTASTTAASEGGGSAKRGAGAENHTGPAKNTGTGDQTQGMDQCANVDRLCLHNSVFICLSYSSYSVFCWTLLSSITFLLLGLISSLHSFNFLFLHSRGRGRKGRNLSEGGWQRRRRESSSCGRQHSNCRQRWRGGRRLWSRENACTRRRWGCRHQDVVAR